MLDREKVIKAIEWCQENACDGCPYDTHNNESCGISDDILALLKEQESVIESLKSDLHETLAVVSERLNVVRCKDCKHYRINTVYPGTNMIMKYCAKTGIAESKPDWFCADGIAKDINVPDKEGR